MTPLLVIVTTADEEEAQKITNVLIEERLAACVTSTPGVGSTYWWQGKVETGTEIVLTIKTSHELWPIVGERVRELHSYECPEIIAIPIVEIDPHYAKWWREILAG
jgi:periplasmic divalent cation tolerance protein